MNKKKLKLLAVPIAVASASVIGMVSGTLAYFTSIDKATVSIEAGQVKVDLSVTDLKTYSLGVEQTAGKFENGGKASISGTAISLNKITPGDKVTFNLDVTNHSNVDMKYRLKARYANEVAGADPHNLLHSAKLSEGLVVSGLDSATQWTNALVATSGTKIVSRSVSVELPKEAGNEYQNATSDIFIEIEAIQKNGPDNNSYGFFDSYKEGGVWYHEITNKAQFQNLLTHINATYTDSTLNDETAVYVITNDIDFNGNVWHDDVTGQDIDSKSFKFIGTLKGKTSNIKFTRLGYNLDSSNGGYSLFADVGEKAVIENLRIGYTDFGTNNDVTYYSGLLVANAKGDPSNKTKELTIRNIVVENTCNIKSNKNYGIVSAENMKLVKAENVINYADIITTSNSGGILGRLLGCTDIYVTNCKNYGTITGSTFASGIVGTVNSSTNVYLNGVENYGDIYSDAVTSPIINQCSTSMLKQRVDVYNCGSVYNDKKFDSGTFGIRAGDVEHISTEAISEVQSMNEQGGEKTSTLKCKEYFDLYYKAAPATLPVSGAYYGDNIEDAHIDTVKELTIDTSAIASQTVTSYTVITKVTTWNAEYNPEVSETDIVPQGMSGTTPVNVADVNVSGSVGASVKIPRLIYAGHTWASGKGEPLANWIVESGPHTYDFDFYHVDDTAANTYGGFHVLTDGSAAAVIDNRLVTAGVYHVIADLPSYVEYKITFFNGKSVVGTASAQDLKKDSGSHIQKISSIA